MSLNDVEISMDTSMDIHIHGNPANMAKLLPVVNQKPELSVYVL